MKHRFLGRDKMKKINSICVISEQYPTTKNSDYEFVAQLVRTWTKMGIQCKVINPVSFTNAIFRGGEIKPKLWFDNSEGLHISIISPRYVSFSTRNIGFINTSKITLKYYQNCIFSYLKNHYSEFDAVYGHFIFPSGIVASNISKTYGIPSFFAYGENTTYTIDYLGEKLTRELLKNINGVISVSSENKRILSKKKIVEQDIIGVFPNSVNNKLFFKHDKIGMRKKHNLPLDTFIIAYVGYFIDIKGANRLSDAINIINNKEIKSIFIGRGDVIPTCEGILQMGPRSHDIVPELLSAADIFVLPTLAEGCCNAIIEAMACGLPIISSDKPFNDDILDDTCSLRIDPMDIDAIATAIKILYENRVLREKLSEGAIKKAKSLNIEERAKNIIHFMEERIQMSST